MSKTKIIHVNQQFIRMNAKDGGRRPVCTIKEGRSGKARYARDIEILGPSRMVTEKDQLACGARVWIETEADVVLHDEMTFQEAKDTQPETPEEEASRLFDRITELQDHLGYGFFEEMERWLYALMEERNRMSNDTVLEFYQVLVSKTESNEADTVNKICQMLESAGQSNEFVGNMFSGEGCDSMQEEYDRFKGYGQEHSEEDEDQNELDLIRDLMSLGVTAMKAKDNYGGEGRGDDYWAVVEVHFGFTSKVAYIKLSGWYASHYGSELGEVYKVSPRIVEKTEWERNS